MAREYEYTEDYVTWNVEQWKKWFAHLIGKPGVKALEVGTYEGRSAVWFLENILTGPGASLVTCDIGCDAAKTARAKANLSHFSNCRMDWRGSQDVLPDLHASADRYHFAYVDGSHDAPDVLRDMCAVWELLLPGGIMLCDDWQWTNRDWPQPPREAIEAWLRIYVRKIRGYEVNSPHRWQIAIWKPGELPSIGAPPGTWAAETA